MKPFIYIASLRRTGSTVLSEALTLLRTHSFPGAKVWRRKVFHQEKRCRDVFEPGIDLESLQNNWSGNKQKYIIEAFKES